MAIDALQTFPQLALPQASFPKNTGNNSASFAALLSSLSDGGNPVQAQQRTAAELCRIQMMQHSLSLFGDGSESSQPDVFAPLESLVASGYPRASLGAPAGADPAGTAPVPDGAAPAADSGMAGIGATASQYLGIPYRFGGESADGIDCSSFVQQVFREHQIDLPRTAREQSQMGTEVAQGDLRKGDLVFFHTYASYPSHVGIYLGEGKMIHASSGKGEVTISDLNSDYYRSRFLGAKRMA